MTSGWLARGKTGRAVTESFQTSKNRQFVTDQSGNILQKTENGKTQNTFYASDTRQIVELDRWTTGT